MRDKLVLETSLVRAVPRRLQEDAELLTRFGELVLEREEIVLPRVPHRRPPRGQHDREAQGKERTRGVAREVEVATYQDASGLAQEQDRRAIPVGMHSDRTGVRTDELVVAENEVGSTWDAIRIVRVRRHLETERLAVLAGVGCARRVRRDQQRCGPRTAHEPERAFAERRSVDEQVPALFVVDDVLALVLERLVQLEDPRPELMNIHGAGLS